MTRIENNKYLIVAKNRFMILIAKKYIFRFQYMKFVVKIFDAFLMATEMSTT